MDIGVIKFCPEELIVLVPHCRISEQWGYPMNVGEIKYPIAFTKKCFCVISTDSQNKGQTPIAMGINSLLNNNFYALPTNAGAFFYIAIGI